MLISCCHLLTQAKSFLQSKVAFTARVLILRQNAGIFFFPLCKFNIRLILNSHLYRIFVVVMCISSSTKCILYCSPIILNCCWLCLFLCIAIFYGLLFRFFAFFFLCFFKCKWWQYGFAFRQIFMQL